VREDRSWCLHIDCFELPSIAIRSHYGVQSLDGSALAQCALNGALCCWAPGLPESRRRQDPTIWCPSQKLPPGCLQRRWYRTSSLSAVVTTDSGSGLFVSQDYQHRLCHNRQSQKDVTLSPLSAMGLGLLEASGHQVGPQDRQISVGLALGPESMFAGVHGCSSRRCTAHQIQVYIFTCPPQFFAASSSFFSSYLPWLGAGRSRTPRTMAESLHCTSWC